MTKILVIDDDDFVRESLKVFLAGEGYEVATANEGGQGLARLAETPFDLVITDILMPNLDGLEFIKRIRQAGQDGLPILAISGGAYFGDTSYAEVAEDLGADANLVKPFENDDLRAMIHQLLDASAD